MLQFEVPVEEDKSAEGAGYPIIPLVFAALAIIGVNSIRQSL